MSDFPDDIALDSPYEGEVEITGTATAVCPMDGRATNYDVTVTYRPRGHIVEAMAFHEWLGTFATTEQTQESLTEAILVNVAFAIDPERVAVELVGDHAPGTTITTTLEQGYPGE